VAGRECYHCKQWIEDGEAHDCWTTTEAALTQDLSEDLRDAWDRLREAAVEFGDQRIYASHHSIMFSRKSCYFFVRPKKSYLEICIFLGRAVAAPHIRRVDPASKTKLVHFIRVTHRDEVEAPITEWLKEAYDLAGPARPTPAHEARSGDRGGPRAAVSERAAAAARDPNRKARQRKRRRAPASRRTATSSRRKKKTSSRS
jgi:hypothetical protein